MSSDSLILATEPRLRERLEQRIASASTNASGEQPDRHELVLDSTCEFLKPRTDGRIFLFRNLSTGKIIQVIVPLDCRDSVTPGEMSNWNQEIKAKYDASSWCISIIHPEEPDGSFTVYSVCDKVLTE